MMNQASCIDKVTLFNSLMQRDVHEYFDVDGRPVGEGRSLAFAQVETKFKVCPYAGSRHHHAKPMNASALQSILPEWQHSLSLLSLLSRRYQAFYNTTVSSYYDLALISGMGVFLSDYLVLRRLQPLATRHIPVMVSGLYKVCLGFQQATFLAMMNDSFNSDNEKTLADAKGFYQYIEEQQLLIGPEEVCGGSEEMISRAYDIMKDQASVTGQADPLPALAGLAIDWDAYDHFSFHSSNLWRKAILFVIQMQGFCLQLNEASLPADLTVAINAYLKASFAQLLAAQSGLAVEIAQITLAESGHSLDEWLTVQAAFLTEIDCQPFTGLDTQALSDAILQQLRQVFDMAGYHQVIAAAIEAHAAKYAAFEAAVLRSFNGHLDAIVLALGFTPANDLLVAGDLTAVYGKTLRDWPDFMQQP
jgi:hypothetical protein